MGFYQDRILPVLIDLSMRQRNLANYRRRVIPAATGRVLEVGIGSGFNLPLYGVNVKQVIGLDPSPKLLAMTGKKVRDIAAAVDLVEGSAEAVPLEDRSVDTVVTTWTMCRSSHTTRRGRPTFPLYSGSRKTFRIALG